MIKQNAKARLVALASLAVLALLSGCARDEFEVDITISPGTLSSATRERINVLRFDVSGADSVQKNIPKPMLFENGEERVRFFAKRGTTGAATITVTALDGMAELASGSGTVTLEKQGVAALRITLASSAAIVDGGVPPDMTTEPASADLSTGTDLADVPAIAFDRSNFHFGTLNVNAVSGAAFFVLTNTGTVDTGPVAATQLGSPAISFDLDECSTKVLAPGASCVVSLKCHPLTPGPIDFVLSMSASPGGTAQLALAGSGVPLDALTITPTSEIFADTEVGAISSATTLTVTNTGASDAEIKGINQTGTDGAQFTIGVDTCTGTTLATGSTCLFQAQFQPTTAGRKTAAIAVVGTTGGTASVPVSGAAVPPAMLTIEPGSQSCGAIALADIGAPVSFTIRNHGMGPSGLLSATLTGADANEFVLDASDCTAALAPSDACVITVTLSPLVQGDKTATLEVSGSPGGLATATVTGKGTTSAQLALAAVPSSTAFPDTTIGDTSTSIEVAIVNSGGANTGAITTSLTDSTNFTIVTDGCVGKALASTETCKVTVALKPTAPAAAESTTLSLTAAPGGSVSVALTGRALSQAAFSISPTTSAFPDTVVNTDSADATFTLTNDGETQSGTIGVTITNETEFIDASVTNKCDGARLDHLGTCVVKIHFHPTSVAIGKQSTLTVSASPGGTKTVMLSGNGVAAGALAIAPTGKDFQQVVINQTSVEQLFTVVNNGGATTSALGTTITGEFAVTSGQNNCEGATLIPGGMCTLKATFKPTSSGSKSGTLRLTAGAASTTASLAGVGISPPALSVNPTTHGFGTIDVGTTSAAVGFVVSNSGDAASAITVTPSGNTSDFQIVNACTTLSGGGDNCTVSVACKPVSQGAKSLSLAISGANGGSTNATSITCQGSAPTLLTVAIAGTGASYGKVVSTVPDAAITCPGTCSKTYGAATNVTLQASVPISAAATFTGWTITGGGTCSGTGTCTVALDVAKTVTANFAIKQYTLTVTKDIKGGATGVVSGGPIACGATCASSFDYGTSITLGVAPDPGFGFGGWANACTGLAGCSVLMTADRTVTAALAPFNKMFVTTTTYTGNLGGLSGADAKCQARATAVGLPGTYIAWLSSSAVNAKDRLVIPSSGGTPARGFQRVDGTAFSDRVTDLVSSPALLYYPPLLPEDGVRISGPLLPWTGTLGDGTKSANRCSEWTSASSAIQGTSASSARIAAPKWTAYGDSNCNTSRALYCFGVDYAVVLPPPQPPPVHRKAFVSTATFSATGGRAGADAICQSEGAAAFGAGKTYLALMAISGSSPASRFAGTVPWVSPSGAIFATDATKLSGALLETGLNRTASNAISNTWFWSGSTAFSDPGTTATTCNSWSSTAGSGSIGDSETAGGFIASATAPCGQAYPVICLEQ